jgi:predicted RNA-binding protein associated with RNAse of E/G family
MPNLPLPIRIHYHRPPDRVTIYSQTLIFDDGRVKVSFAQGLELPEPVRAEGEIILEEGSDAIWFTFPGAWHDIGLFHRTDGSFTGVYANVITPCVFQPGGEWETSDLFLDLWIPSGSDRPPVLLDEEELAAAESSGALSRATTERARNEANRLLRAASRGQWPPRLLGRWDRARCQALLEG